MGFECNIDARGKAVRLRLGLMGVLSSLGLAAACLLISAPDLAWIVPAGAFIGGAFAIFEGRTGWCVVRALGFRTPI
ncbi:MAG: hypothetical protein CMA50_00010 [Euryarchaeota archaeon]|jgi:hypothetical protein|nr:hypothetical protein [Euryarchaeota archaeon]